MLYRILLSNLKVADVLGGAPAYRSATVLSSPARRMQADSLPGRAPGLITIYKAQDVVLEDAQIAA